MEQRGAGDFEAIPCEDLRVHRLHRFTQNFKNGVIADGGMGWRPSGKFLIVNCKLLVRVNEGKQ
jgi:hypothetical protein